MNKSTLIRILLLSVFAASGLSSCCPRPILANQSPEILPLPPLVMAQNQNYNLNLAPFGSDDYDFGDNLTWSVIGDEIGLVAVAIDPIKPLLLIFSGNNIGTTSVTLILTDSEGLSSPPQALAIEVRGISGEGEGEGEPANFKLALSARPPESGEVSAVPDRDGYPAGSAVTVSFTPAAGWEFDHWEGPVGNAQANPTMVVMVADLDIVASGKPINPGEGEGEVIPDCDIDSPANFFRFVIILLDTNGDGELSWAEIKAKFPKLEDNYQQLVMSADSDGNGSLSEEEWVNSIIPAFLVAYAGPLDANGDNVFTYEETIAVVSEITPEDFRQSRPKRQRRGRLRRSLRLFSGDIIFSGMAFALPVFYFDKM